MSGKVMPSATDCGAMSNAAKLHLVTSTQPESPSAGKTLSCATRMAPSNSGWKPSPANPISPSTTA